MPWKPPSNPWKEFCTCCAAWVKTVGEASRLDLHAPARALAEVTREIFARDTARRRAHEAAFAVLAGDGR